MQLQLMLKKLSFILVLLAISIPVQSQPEEMVLIEGGNYMPFYHSADDSVDVKSFYMDVYPVTNADFLAFVIEHKEWQSNHLKSVFAGDDYLQHWKGNLNLGENVHPQSPVTNVSWFAARAYAKWKDKRLPTLDEWEYVASASASKRLAARDDHFVQKILDWYSRTSPGKLPTIGQGENNYHGVYNMHGLVWEWVRDFNTVFVSGESRADQGELKQFYCAAGSSAAADKDKSNYAAFLRYALRGSLEADFSVGNLGFRCAMDKDKRK